MAEPCPITELDPSMCAHCRKLPDPFAVPTTARQSGSVGPSFSAQYAGKCACGEPFPAGAPIRADGDGGYLASCCTDLIGDLS